MKRHIIMAAPMEETLQASFPVIVFCCKIQFPLKVKQIWCLKYLSAGKD